MNKTKHGNRLKLVTWNIERSSISRFEEQLTALQERSPDIVALQEVGVKASRCPHRLLRDHGFDHTAHSHDFHLEDFENSSGVAFASRWPFRICSPDTFDMPAKHHALSAEFFTPFGRIEGHTVHVLPGSMVGETKTEMFEGIYDRLAQDDPPEYRFLCGDFNSPKDESADGDVTVWGSDDRKIKAERNVIVGLAEYDLPDVYREVTGYGDDEYSWVARNQGNEWPRRFDHVFASQKLNATEATYLHQYDGLSDHTPLEVTFTPDKGRRYADNKATDRSVDTQTTSNDGRVSSSTVSYDGLTYNGDIRTIAPDANYRRGRFKVGWDKAVDGVNMDSALDQLTWENLGWRLGKLFGKTPEGLQDELYDWCVKQQIE